jgi:hypothetical protein
MEKSGNLRKDLKQDIVNSISTLRNICVKLKYTAEEQIVKIIQLESDVNKLKAELQESGVVNLSARVQPSRGGTGQIPVTSVKHQQPSSGGVLITGFDKRYKLTVKSRFSQSAETIKSVLKTKVNPTEMKVGIKTFKDGRVLIVVGSLILILNLLCTIISNKCGEELEVNVPKFWKPRLIIHNIPQDITVENLEETIIVQNQELGIKMCDIAARFRFRTKRELISMVTEAGSETRKKLFQKKKKN